DPVPLRRLDDGFVRARRRGFAVQAKLDQFGSKRDFRCVHTSSFGKYLTTQAIGFGAACPSPQIDASAIACESSASSAVSHFGFESSPTAFSVPTRQGVHCPQDSSAKKRIRLSAASRARSCCDRTITAAEPMKQPCGCKVSKSSGTSASDAGRMPPEAPPGRYP